uniref:Uncharacterized protein n=1 Tax=Lepeophtheirus salmonis TaxID=72036 RepID=A0A0K2U6U4_LEPSM
MNLISTRFNYSLQMRSEGSTYIIINISCRRLPLMRLLKGSEVCDATLVDSTGFDSKYMHPFLKIQRIQIEGLGSSKVFGAEIHVFFSNPSLLINHL